MSNPYRPQSAEILNDVWDSATDSLRVTSSQLGILLNALLASQPGLGTSGVPSDDVISVQGPNNQFGTITFTANGQALVLNCEGMASATFYCRSAGTLTVQFQLDYGGTGNWVPSEFLVHIAGTNAPLAGYAAQTPALNQWYALNTKGAKRVRCVAITWTSGGVIDGVVSPSTIHNNVEVSGFSATVPTVTTVSTVTNVSSINGFAGAATATNYSDTTTVLAAGATFNGTLRTMMAAGSSSGAFYADFFSNQASATNGAKIQKSIDAGVTWIDAAVGTLTAGVPLSLRVPITAASYRVSYTNGATLQTAPFSITSGNKLFP